MPKRILTEEQAEAARVRARRYAAENPEKVKTARKAVYWRDAEANREASVAYRTANLEERRAAEARYREAHREELREKQRVSNLSPERRQAALDNAKRQAARRRAAVAKGEAIDREAIAARDNWSCGICGRAITTGTLSLDHIVPIADEGLHVAENVRAAHLSCNQSRPRKVAS